MMRGEETNKNGTEGGEGKEAGLVALSRCTPVSTMAVAVDSPVVDISCRNEFYIKCVGFFVVGVFLFSSKVHLCCYIHQHLIS